MNEIRLARQRFRSVIRQPEHLLNLAEAALHIAWEDQQVGQPAYGLQQLDALADTARARLEGIDEPHHIVATLNEYLFDELGFQGSASSDGPENSFLDYALTNRTGLPITLSVIYMEIGWRLGLPVAGVALPGHFLARYSAPDEDIVIDPFNKGRRWSREECEAKVVATYGSVSPILMRQTMAPPSKKAVLARMLRNLKYTYVRLEAIDKALAAIERILLLEPNDAHEIRDRGLLLARLGLVYGSLEDLDRYAMLASGASDLAQLRQFAKTLADRLIVNN